MKLPTDIHDILLGLVAAGGRPLLVGGTARDLWLGRRIRDWDVEVFRLSARDLEKALQPYGRVKQVGMAFGIFILEGRAMDFAIPRLDIQTGPGHRGFQVALKPDATFAEAASRRDLTINSMGFDPFTETWLDPFGGRKDLEAGRLRATNPARFSEDPLRGLRVMQLAARLGLRPDGELIALCRQQDLGQLSAERLYGEFQKWLGQGVLCSLGLEAFLASHYDEAFPIFQLRQPQALGQAWDRLAAWDQPWCAPGFGEETSSDAELGARSWASPGLTEEQRVAGMLALLGWHAKADGGNEAQAQTKLENFLSTIGVPSRIQKWALGFYWTGKGTLPHTLFDLRQWARELAPHGLNLYQALLWHHVRQPGGGTSISSMLELAEADHILFRSPQDCVRGKDVLGAGVPKGPQVEQVLRRCRQVQDQMLPLGAGFGASEPSSLGRAILKKALQVDKL